MRMLRILLPLAGLVLALIALAGCGTSALLADVGVSAPVLQPTGNGEHVNINYRIGRQSKVTIYLQDEQGTHYPLREDVPRSPSTDPYTLRFDGTAPTSDPLFKRKALPSGTYTVVVLAAGDDGSREQQQVALTINGADSTPPQIEDLVVFPQTITPNADGIDDVAEITYRMPVTATVDIELTGPGCRPCPFVTADEEEPELQRHVWNGRTVDNILLSNGVYTYTVRAQDRYGNLVEHQGNMTIAGAGQPEARITYSYMAPQAIMRGEVITVTMRVKNTGKVPIRTYGPPSGYEYSTEQVFSSIADGQYAAKSGGFWRIGVDWDANSGGAAKRYPYRWAISPRPPDQWKIPHVEDELRPGEEAEVIGRIRVFQQETKMGFFAGLIQDGVGFFQDRTGRTIIEVSF